MENIKWFIASIKNAFSVFKRANSLDNVANYQEFMVTRSAFIAQKTLYGYLKTRMGMQYPKMFEDDAFVKSINIAKWNIYAACLSDLAVFMVAQTLLHTEDRNEAVKMAKTLHESSIRSRFGDGEFQGDIEALIKDFSTRLDTVEWDNATQYDGAFSTSVVALIKWSPIAENLKKFDKPLVENSIKFSWQAIRREFHKLYMHDKFIENYRI